MTPGRGLTDGGVRKRHTGMEKCILKKAHYQSRGGPPEIGILLEWEEHLKGDTLLDEGRYTQGRFHCFELSNLGFWKLILLFLSAQLQFTYQEKCTMLTCKCNQNNNCYEWQMPYPLDTGKGGLTLLYGL